MSGANPAEPRRPPPDPPGPRRPRLLAALAAALAAGLVTGLVDGLLAVVRGAPSGWYLLAGSGTFAWVALPLSVPLLLAGDRAVTRWRERLPDAGHQRRALAVTLLGAAAILAGLVTAAVAWSVRDQATRAGWRMVAVAVPVALLVAAAAGRALWRLCATRPRGTIALALGLLLTAGTAVVLARHHLAPLDLRFGWVAATAVAGLAVGQWRLQRPPARARVLWGFVGACAILAVVGTGLMIRDLQVRISAINYAPVGDAPLRLWARAADFDGDGHSALYGDGDCDPWRAEIHPLAVDLPGNGIDEDCHGGDLDPAAVAPRPQPPPPPSPLDHPPSILMISVDTLRADHMGLYGYARDTTPNIDRWFSDAVIFDRAYSTSPVTDRAFQSLTGGLYPSMFTEALDYETHVMGDRRVLLAESLQAAGYYTATINSYHLLDDFNMHQGFQEVLILGDAKRQDAHNTTRMALGTLRRHAHRSRAEPSPLLLWVHYYEPHARYTPPDEHRHWDGGGPFDLEDPMDLYDAEIHYVDAEIGRLLSVAGKRGWLDGAIVIFFADHGEEFLDHGGTRHARKLYDEQIRIPLMVADPRGTPRRAPHRVASVVSLVDVLPTVLELVGLPDPGTLVGRSFVPALRGEPLAERVVLMEQFKHGSAEIQRVGAVRGSMKLILGVKQELWELYDLERDPGETSNIYGDPRGEPLRVELLDHWSRSRAAAHLAPPEGAF